MQKRSYLSSKAVRNFQLSSIKHRHLLSFEGFFLQFGGKLSGDNRWIKLAQLIPCYELEDYYAEQSCKAIGATAKPFNMFLSALIIKTRPRIMA